MYYLISALKHVVYHFTLGEEEGTDTHFHEDREVDDRERPQFMSCHNDNEDNTALLSSNEDEVDQPVKDLQRAIEKAYEGGKSEICYGVAIGNGRPTTRQEVSEDGGKGKNIYEPRSDEKTEGSLETHEMIAAQQKQLMELQQQVNLGLTIYQMHMGK